MNIDLDILFAWGGIAKTYKKHEYIFHEGEHARFYHQIVSGTVKMFNVGFDGKEFTQAEFEKGNSFGEPAMMIDEAYPTTAIATEDSVILKMNKERFLRILDEYPVLQKRFITLLAKRIYNKTLIARSIISNSCENRIITFLNSYKKKYNCGNREIEIPYTRQEIANFTGLRVETVIRTLSKMQHKNQVKIINRKLIF